MTRPTPDILRRAALLLDAAIGTDGGPADGDLVQVVDWMHQQAEDAELRSACRAAGVPVSHVRRRLRASP